MEAEVIREIVHSQERAYKRAVRLIKNGKCTIGFRLKQDRNQFKRKIYVYLVKYCSTKEVTINTGYSITMQQWDQGRLSHCTNRDAIYSRIAELVTIAEYNMARYTRDEISAMTTKEIALKIFEIRHFDNSNDVCEKKCTSVAVKLSEEEAIRFSNTMKACGITSREVFFKEFLPLLIFGTIKSELVTDKTKILAMNQKKRQ